MTSPRIASMPRRLAELGDGRAVDDHGGGTSIDDEPFQAVERLADLPGGDGERANGGGVAIEGDHVVAPGWPILKHEDLTPPFGAQVEQFVARAAQETGEIEVAGLEGPLSFCPRCIIACPVDT